MVARLFLDTGRQQRSPFTAFFLQSTEVPPPEDLFSLSAYSIYRGETMSSSDQQTTPQPIAETAALTEDDIRTMSREEFAQPFQPAAANTNPEATADTTDTQLPTSAPLSKWIRNYYYCYAMIQVPAGLAGLTARGLLARPRRLAACARSLYLIL